MKKIMNFIRISMFTVLSCASFRTMAEPQNFGYRVTTADKTIIQIARDVYNDERLWKKISYWNNIRPPYSLKSGQILILPYLPVNPIPAENSVAANELSSPVFLDKLPSVEQQIINHSGHFTYVVNERAPSLSMVAHENYGNKKMAAVIAKWNGLSPNSKLSLAQQLKLKIKPRFSVDEANAALISQWTKMRNPEMVLRLSGKISYAKLKMDRKVTKKTPVKTAIQNTPAASLPPAPVVFESDPKREPAAVPPAELKSETSTEINSDTSWFGEKSSNAIESLLRSISY